MHPQSLKIVLVVYFYLTSKTLCQTFGGVMVADLLEMKKFSKDVPPPQTSKRKFALKRGEYHGLTSNFLIRRIISFKLANYQVFCDFRHHRKIYFALKI